MRIYLFYPYFCRLNVKTLVWVCIWVCVRICTEKRNGTKGYALGYALFGVLSVNTPLLCT
nr:MAG TPA: hypothetical protein [Caudoviricetes sp.]